MKLGSLDFPDALVSAVCDGTLVIFAGAGVSMGEPAYLPSFKRLTELIAAGTAERQQENEPEDRFLGRLQHKGVDVHARAAKELSRDDLTSTAFHRDLLRLHPSIERVRIVTTNFDLLFEHVNPPKELRSPVRCHRLWITAVSYREVSRQCPASGKTAARERDDRQGVRCAADTHGSPDHGLSEVLDVQLGQHRGETPYGPGTVLTPGQVGERNLLAGVTPSEAAMGEQVGVTENKPDEAIDFIHVPQPSRLLAKAGSVVGEADPLKGPPSPPIRGSSTVIAAASGRPLPRDNATEDRGAPDMRACVRFAYDDATGKPVWPGTILRGKVTAGVGRNLVDSGLSA